MKIDDVLELAAAEAQEFERGIDMFPRELAVITLG